MNKAPPGVNQQMVINAIYRNPGITSKALEKQFIPHKLKYSDLDKSIGALLRKGAIRGVYDGANTRYTLTTPYPPDAWLSGAQAELLRAIKDEPLPYRQAMATAHEENIRTLDRAKYALTSLRNHGYVTFPSRSNTAHVTITKSGRVAMGWEL